MRKLCVAIAAVMALAVPPSAGAVVAERDQVATSFDGTKIVYNLFLPDEASAENPVPMILQTHGWGGSRSNNPPGWVIDAGYGLLTWDQRGFGDSGGTVHIDSKDYEARDVHALIDLLAADPRVALDAAGDPKVGMMGGSYAGGVQFVAAAIDTAGRIDAIAPEIAWNDLKDSLSPDDVVKIAWGTLLYGAGAPGAYPNGFDRGEFDGYDPAIHRAFVEGTTLGVWTDETKEFFVSRGPHDVLDAITAPTFILQATTDTLFPPSQAARNYEALAATTSVPLKMQWHCGGHGICNGVGGKDGNDAGHTDRALQAWFDRYVKADDSVSTGAGFDFLDQNGDWHSGGRWPVRRAGTRSGSGGGVVTVPGEPTAGGVVGANASEGRTSLEIPIESRTGTLIGEPRVTMSATAVGTGTTDRQLELPLFFQLVDKSNGKVLGNQVTPKVLTADGQRREYEFTIEGVSYATDADDELVLEVVATSSNFVMHRGGGVVDIDVLEIEIPALGTRGQGKPLGQARPQRLD